MTCSECSGDQFYTKRLKHKLVCWVCGNCYAEVPIKKPKQAKDTKIENKEGDK